MIDVKFGVASNGNGGLIEQPKFEGLDVRVFEILDNDVVQFRYHNEWQESGNRARSYGCNVKPNQLSVGSNPVTYCECHAKFEDCGYQDCCR